MLFFVPSLGMAFGAGMGALMGKVEQTGIDKSQDRIRVPSKPGTSALFLIVEKVTPRPGGGSLSKYGGTVLKTPLTEEAVEGIAGGAPYWAEGLSHSA